MTGLSNRFTSLVHELGSILRTPIPGADFLDSWIPMPTILNAATNAAANARKRFSRRPGYEPITPATFLLQGALRRANGGNITVEGELVEVCEATWIFGELKNGSQVSVTGEVSPHGRRQARKIIVLRGPQ